MAIRMPEPKLGRHTTRLVRIQGKERRGEASTELGLRQKRYVKEPTERQACFGRASKADAAQIIPMIMIIAEYPCRCILGRNGIVKGGGGKLSCLRQVNLHPITIKGLVKTPCRNIIEELRSVFNDFYLGVHGDPLLIASEPDPEFEAEMAQDPRVLEAQRKLRSSEWILSLINRHLASAWDVDDDGSLCKTELRPDPAASGNRRKRKAADSADDKTTYNQRRQGRLPPSKSVPSGDTLSSQGRGFFRIPIAASPHGELRTSSGASPSDGSRARSGSSFT
jgi:hypothetical protein